MPLVRSGGAMVMEIGRCVIPGLVDAHTHVPLRFLIHP